MGRWGWSGSKDWNDSQKMMWMWNDNGVFEGICEGHWQGSWDWNGQEVWCRIQFKEAWKDEEKACNGEEQKPFVDMVAVFVSWTLFSIFVKLM